MQVTPSGLSHTPRETCRVMKLCIDSFIQVQAQRPEQRPRKPPLKVRFPVLYYAKSHMECYHSDQQYDDDFDTAGATSSDCTPFAISFICDKIGSCWHQHKGYIQAYGVTPLSWIDFKAFSERISEISGPLWIATEVGLSEILSTS